MARPSYRRRDDGVLQIVRPNPLARLGPPARRAVAVLLVAFAAGGVVGLYLLLGVPFLLLACSVALAAILWRTGQPRRPAAQVHPVARRSAP